MTNPSVLAKLLPRVAKAGAFAEHGGAALVGLVSVKSPDMGMGRNESAGGPQVLARVPFSIPIFDPQPNEITWALGSLVSVSFPNDAD